MRLTAASIFTDNMILQQGLTVPVWGMADPEARVTVSFRGQAETAIADADGKWLVKLAPMAASAEPAELTVSSVAVAEGSEPNTLKFVNVLVGEAWICSGQSNMEWPLSLTCDADEKIAAANFPFIRLFTVNKRTSGTPVADIPHGQWCCCTPESAAQFSAVGYFYGRELHGHLGVPVGIINASWGGTVAEAWVSREGLLDTEPCVREMIELYEKDLADLPGATARWKVAVDAIEARTRDTGDTGWPRGWADMPEPTGEWKDIKLPCYWQSQGLNFSGILWFRKIIDVPAAWAGKDLTLSIGATDKSDITYFNNVKVGSITMAQRPDAWSTLRSYTVPGYLVKAGKNIIAVRVHSDMYAGGMTGPANVMKLVCPDLAEESIQLDGLWRYAVEANYGFVAVPSQPAGPDNQNSPCTLFNGMIAPVIPFAMRGAIWYQGESNASRAHQYRTLFPALIRDWRRCWGRDDFGFYFVQLANYMGRPDYPGDSPWAELREAQTMTLKLPCTGMAVTIDIGDAEDIHPRNKEDVGKRLAFNALHQSYGQKDIIPCGPLFREMKIEGRAMRLFFDYVGDGLKCGGDKLEGFAVAGDDGKFVWADARIDPAANTGLAEETVIVESPLVSVPAAVRYAWADNPACNLYNRAGLPASPFRTDPD